MRAFVHPRRIIVGSLLSILILLSCGRERLEAGDPAASPAATLLSEYLRIDTSNPPGDETRGAEWLAGKLTAAGIESQLLGDDPRRQSLYARLEAPGDEPALLLLHHIDVVPANIDEWSVEPFGGEIRNGYVWGRGAIDAKSLGIAHLLSFIDLAHDPSRLTRDVIFLAVADEETGGRTGTESLLNSHPDLFSDVGYVLNEGGGNQVIVDETIYWGVEIDQKVPLWVEIVARGNGGHGAGIHDDSAVMRMLRILDRVRRVESTPAVTSSVRQYFRAVSRVTRGQKSEVLAGIDRFIDSPRLDTILPKGYRGLLEDTWTISVLAAGSSVNVVPDRASAQIDIRLRPGSRTEPVLQQLESMVRGEAEVRVLLAGKPAPASSVDTELWRSIESVLLQQSPDSVVGPLVSPGSTDSRFFRERGIIAYGFSPFKINFYDFATVHGVDERIRLSFLNDGVETMKAIVESFCAAGG